MWHVTKIITVNCQLSPIRQAQGDPELVKGPKIKCYERLFILQNSIKGIIF